MAGLLLVDTSAPSQTGLIRRTMPAQFATLSALMLQEPAHVRREFEDAAAAESQILAYPPCRGGASRHACRKQERPAQQRLASGSPAGAMRALAQSCGATYQLVNCGYFIQRPRPQAVVDAVRSILA